MIEGETKCGLVWFDFLLATAEAAFFGGIGYWIVWNFVHISVRIRVSLSPAVCVLFVCLFVCNIHLIVSRLIA